MLDLSGGIGGTIPASGMIFQIQQCRRLFRLFRLDAIRSADANYAGTFTSFAANDEIASPTYLLAGAVAVLP